MAITYELGKSLYVNITNRCSNACTFCVRNKHDGVNGKDNLWLDREPTVDEIKADFQKCDLSKYDAVVFCGYGEPTERIGDLLEVARWIKSFSNIKIRINTNGQGNLIAGRDITPDMEGVIDCVSISLNAENAEKYQELCRSKFGGKAAFDGLQEFASLSKRYIGEVVFTVVDLMSKEEIENCRKIAEECGVDFRVREMIK